MGKGQMNKILNFRISTLCFALLIVVLLVFDNVKGLSNWTYLISAVGYFVVVGIGSSNIASQFHLHAICKGESSEKKISITFDDGPVSEYTPQVLDLLKKYHANATFFLIGRKIQGSEDIIRRIDSEGHIVGNHTFSHAYMFDFYPAVTVTKELERTNLIIKNIINKNPQFFRPPYGVTNRAITKAVKRLKLDVIGWNQRSLDTIVDDEEKILKRITSNLKGGDIVLFHDIHPRIITLLEKFLIHCRDNGFIIANLEELINKKAYA
jgi:peptidoglycan-N-acetylglucosamine deacetylase